MTSHNITLPDELSQLVSSKVTSGQYASVSEVIRSYIRVGSEVEEQQELKKKQLELMLAKAEKDFVAGNTIEFSTPDEMSSFLMTSAQTVIQQGNA